MAASVRGGRLHVFRTVDGGWVGSRVRSEAAADGAGAGVVDGGHEAADEMGNVILVLLISRRCGPASPG